MRYLNQTETIDLEHLIGDHKNYFKVRAYIEKMLNDAECKREHGCPEEGQSQDTDALSVGEIRPGDRVLALWGSSVRYDLMVTSVDSDCITGWYLLPEDTTPSFGHFLTDVYTFYLHKD